MALRLDDIKSPQTKKKTSFSPSWSEIDDTQVGLEKSRTFTQNSEALADKLRPWQSFEDQNQLRTYAAREAIERANKIREKNDLMCAKLRLGHVSDEKEQMLKLEASKREELFNFEKTEMRMREAKIKTASSFVSFFRDLLKQ